MGKSGEKMPDDLGPIVEIWAELPAAKTGRTALRENAVAPEGFRYRGKSCKGAGYLLEYNIDGFFRGSGILQE